MTNVDVIARFLDVKLAFNDADNGRTQVSFG
jgi:hypothetical protein